jgi:hypothetical protein
MKLNYAQRLRVVETFKSSLFAHTKKKRDVVSEHLASENIFISGRGVWNLMVKFRRFGSVETRPSAIRNCKNTKVTLRQLNHIEKMLRVDRGLTAETIRRKTGIRVTMRTLRKYCNILGWRKIRTKYCQTVSTKNRIERVVYSMFCIDSKENFNHTIFIDESTVAMNSNSRTIWFKVFPHENAFGLVGAHKHPLKVK